MVRNRRDLKVLAFIVSSLIFGLAIASSALYSPRSLKNKVSIENIEKIVCDVGGYNYHLYELPEEKITEFIELAQKTNFVIWYNFRGLKRVPRAYFYYYIYYSDGSYIQLSRVNFIRFDTMGNILDCYYFSGLYTDPFPQIEALLDRTNII